MRQVIKKKFAKHWPLKPERTSCDSRQQRTRRLAWSITLATALCVAMPSSATTNLASPALPTFHDGGAWKAGHVQGIAIDMDGGFIYYSFTSMIAKYDFAGNLVGTLTGIAGHLGDLDFNPEDGRIYGSLEYKDDNAFYVAVVDGAAINRNGIDAQDSGILKTIYLPEVTKDYFADLDGDGVFAGNVGNTADHRYGTSGIDGVSFGPRFGTTEGEQMLTVAYGVYPNVERGDNNHQILLQYSVKDWSNLALPLQESQPHRSGPQHHDGKYFLRTGHTTYGVQNLSYDADMQRWFLGVYQGKKPDFPNYTLFAIDALAAPNLAPLQGVPTPSGAGDELGAILPLSKEGLVDAATGISGWMQKGDVGFQPVGNGLFYIAQNGKVGALQTATLTLVRWTGEPTRPFATVDASRVVPN